METTNKKITKTKQDKINFYTKEVIRAIRKGLNYSQCLEIRIKLIKKRITLTAINFQNSNPISLLEAKNNDYINALIEGLKEGLNK